MNRIKNIILLFCLLFVTIIYSFGQKQTQEYINNIKKGDSLYRINDFKGAAFSYSDAFKANSWKSSLNDRYNAACYWALAGYSDSAFFNLEKIATKLNYSNYNQIINDEDLISLHNDNRWNPLIVLIKSNKEKLEINFNKPLVQELDSILTDDQMYRKMIDSIQKKYGDGSKEMKEYGKIIHEKDSVNLVKVENILDKYGWVGSDVVGEEGNITLFLVIQHADLKTQKKYLPMMKEAVKNGKARSNSLALLIDRVEMGNGRPQIYGSQVIKKDNKDVVYKIIDESNVNKRRAEVGLEPLEDYLKQWNIEYKLPEK